MRLWQALAHILKIHMASIGEHIFGHYPSGCRGYEGFRAEAEAVFVEVNVLSDDLRGIGPDTPIFMPGYLSRRAGREENVDLESEFGSWIRGLNDRLLISR